MKRNFISFLVLVLFNIQLVLLKENNLSSQDSETQRLITKLKIREEYQLEIKGMVESYDREKNYQEVLSQTLMTNHFLSDEELIGMSRMIDENKLSKEEIKRIVLNKLSQNPAYQYWKNEVENTESKNQVLQKRILKKIREISIPKTVDSIKKVIDELNKNYKYNIRKRLFNLIFFVINENIKKGYITNWRIVKSFLVKSEREIKHMKYVYNRSKEKFGELNSSENHHLFTNDEDMIEEYKKFLEEISNDNNLEYAF